MRRFTCECGHTLFFENDKCLGCGCDVGFDPAQMAMVSLGGATNPAGLRRCRNATDALDPAAGWATLATDARPTLCNWLLAADDPVDYCRACRLNALVPNLSRERGLTLWLRLEAAKRRLIYSLLRLGLPVDDTPGEVALRFEFVEDRRSNPNVVEDFVTTGHAGGVITINAAEADPVFREKQRHMSRQNYRTLLGHMRHESGHYYFLRLVDAHGEHAAWRAAFGDERTDYGAALKAFYAGTGATYTDSHISYYASSHPHEDWAECWTHVLHMAGTFETAVDFGISNVSVELADFEDWLVEWPRLGVMLNELNRSMGLNDAYPFSHTPAVTDKLREVVKVMRSATPS